ncbi:hypothetical protein EYF80_066537 [Liparis tanakae]|uniref:HTH hxlR-type domain-containing protein n=1 Tax=Liparis tanakae TaxID=230148 RepID=A0A4Z2E3Y8_9TELE|nr:hypothetical protein EYF80_066537 [Liparis tanakae]
MVKLRLDPDCRLLLRRRRSFSRKWECILVSWSRQGNMAYTVAALHRHAPRVSLKVLALQLQILQQGGVVEFS